MWMNVQVTMSATCTPSVRTQTVATRAAVFMVTREMERSVQVSVRVPPWYVLRSINLLNLVFFADFADAF